MHPNAIPTNPTKRKIERAAFSATVVPSRRRALVDPLERVAAGRLERGDEGQDEARDQRAADGKVLPEQRHHLHDLAECHRRVRAQIAAARFAALYARMWASATSRTSR